MSDEGVVTIGRFLDDHYEKFAIVGIFGTVSVFLTGNFPGDNQLLANIGTVASLSIFVLTSFWLGRESMNILLHHRGEIDILTEIGYFLLAAATTILGATVVMSVVTYSAAVEILTKAMIVGIGLLLYGRVFDTERYDLENFSAGSNSLISVYGVLLLYISYETGILFIGDQLDYHWLIEIPAVLIGLGVVHLALCEGVAALARIIQMKSFSIRSYQNYSGILMMSPILFSIVLSLWPPSTPNGYVAILGWYWQSFVALYWFAISALTVYISLILPDRDSSASSKLRLVRTLTAITWVFTAWLALGYNQGWVGKVVIPL